MLSVDEIAINPPVNNSNWWVFCIVITAVFRPFTTAIYNKVTFPCNLCKVGAFLPHFPPCPLYYKNIKKNVTL